MARKAKVKIIRQAWGNQVMAGKQMRGFLADLGGDVAVKLPGGKVEVSSSRVIAGGRRARATISSDVSLADEAETGQALRALKSVVPSAHKPKGEVAKARKKRARGRRKK